MKKKLLSLLIISVLTLNGFAQQPQQQIWYLKNQSIDFRGATPVLTQGLIGYPTTSPPPSGASINGVHNQNGDLLFYVTGDKVINKIGNLMGQLSTLGVQSHGEMTIVPVPTVSCQYYVITQDISVGSPCGPGNSYNLSYSRIDMSLNGGLGGIISTGTVLNSCEYFGGTAIAVGKLNANNTHFLYQVGIAGITNLIITRYTIDNTGNINTPTILYSDNMQGLSSSAAELDLSFNDDRLAFTVQNKLFILNLDGNGSVITSVGNQGNGLSKFTFGFNFLTGVEFSTTGNNLFVGQRNVGIHVVNNTTTGASILLAGSNLPNYGNSQLETAYDAGGVNKIYVANGTDLGEISDINLAVPTFTANKVSGYNALQDPTSATAVYQLPDQIDNFDYSSQFLNNSVSCCVASSSFDVEAANGNEEHSISATWGLGSNPFSNTVGVVTVKDKLVIKTGTNITINNMTFEFAPEALLIIEDGAQLTINNSTLTVNTNCGAAAMWHGVEVWGNGAFQPSTSGTFIANNSLIENAIEATANYQHLLINGSPSIDLVVGGSTGGIIQLTGTTMRNNKLDVNMNKYQSMIFNFALNDRSIFRDCNFVTDALLNDPNEFITTHVNLNSVNGIRFLGCDFQNIAPVGVYTYLTRGSGILAQDSKLSVEAPCSINLPFPSSCPPANLDKCHFNNLVLGVRSSSSNPLKTASIRNSEFFDVFRGVSLAGMKVANVSDNIFDVGMNSGLSGFNVSYGLALVGCDGYKVENNDFHTSFNGYLGCAVVNSGAGANEIYRNTFTDLTIGSQAQQINGDGSASFSQNGLEFRCNKYFTTSDFDILIASGRVRSDQGNCIPTNVKSPANNQFSYTAQYGDYWLNNPPTFPITSTYHYSPNGNSSNLPPRAISTGFSTDYINLINTSEQVCSNLANFNELNSCPKTTGKTVSHLKAELSTLKVIVNDLKDRIDNGDTQGLLNQISTTSGGNLKNVLMAASPLLSDDVLIAYILSNPSNGNLKLVLLANSPLNSAVLDVLSTISLPKGIKNEINNAQTGISPRQELEGEISYYQAEATKINNEIIRLLLFDFSTDGKENFKDVTDFLQIDEVNNTNRENQLLVNAMMANQDFTAAQQKLSGIHSNPENADFCKLNSTVISCQQFIEKELVLLTNMGLQQHVNDVANATTDKLEVTSAKMLKEVVGLSPLSLVNIEMVIPPSSSQRMAQTMNNSGILVEDVIVNIFPNPTDGQFTLSHNLDIVNGSILMVVYDLMGKEVLSKTINESEQIVNVNLLKSGIYFYKVIQNNNIIKSDKLMIK